MSLNGNLIKTFVMRKSQTSSVAFTFYRKFYRQNCKTPHFFCISSYSPSFVSIPPFSPFSSSSPCSSPSPASTRRLSSFISLFSFSPSPPSSLPSLLLSSSSSSLQVRWFGVKNKRRGLPQQPRKKPKNEERSIKNPILYAKKLSTVDNIIQGELFTPEACKSRKLAMLCNRLVYFGYAETSLLDRYAERAITLAPGMMPKQFALILNSMARCSHLHTGLMEAFALHIPPRLPDFIPQDLSLTCHAYGILNVPHKKLFRRLGEEIPHKLPHFESQHFANVALAFAKLNIRDIFLLDDMAEELTERSEEIGGRAAVTLMYSFARLGYEKHKFWEMMRGIIQTVRLELEAFSFVLILYALGKVRHIHDEFSHFLGRELLYFFDEINLRHFGWIVNAYASLGIHHPQLFQKISDKLCAATDGEWAAHVEPIHITQIVSGHSRLMVYDESLFDVMGRRILLHTERGEFSPQSIAVIVNGFAKLSIQNVRLFTLLAKEIVKKLPDFSSQALALIAHGYAKLHIRSELLFHLLSQEMLKKLPSFSAQGLGMILFSYGRLQLTNEKLFNQIVKCVELLLPEMTRIECLIVQSALTKLGILTGDTEEEGGIGRKIEEKIRQTSPLGVFADDDANANEQLFDRLAAQESLEVLETEKKESGGVEDDVKEEENERRKKISNAVDNEDDVDGKKKNSSISYNTEKERKNSIREGEKKRRRGGGDNEEEEKSLAILMKSGFRSTDNTNTTNSSFPSSSFSSASSGILGEWGNPLTDDVDAIRRYVSKEKEKKSMRRCTKIVKGKEEEKGLDEEKLMSCWASPTSVNHMVDRVMKMNVERESEEGEGREEEIQGRKSRKRIKRKLELYDVMEERRGRQGEEEVREALQKEWNERRSGEKRGIHAEEEEQFRWSNDEKDEDEEREGWMRRDMRKIENTENGERMGEEGWKSRSSKRYSEKRGIRRRRSNEKKYKEEERIVKDRIPSLYISGAESQSRSPKRGSVAADVRESKEFFDNNNYMNNGSRNSSMMSKRKNSRRNERRPIGNEVSSGSERRQTLKKNEGIDGSAITIRNEKMKAQAQEEGGFEVGFERLGEEDTQRDIYLRRQRRRNGGGDDGYRRRGEGRRSSYIGRGRKSGRWKI